MGGRDRGRARQGGRAQGLVWLACHQRLNLHSVLGQGAGLVRTDVGDRAQGFDRWQAADQRVDGHHPARAQGQQHRDHCRQRFRNCSHRQTDGCHRHQQRCLATQHTHTKDDGTNGQNGQCHTFAKSSQTPLQRGAAESVLRQQFCHFAQLGGPTNGHHQAVPPPMRGRGALVSHVEAVTESRRCVGEQGRVFVHRDRFAGQRRLVHLELCRLDQSQVGRHLVARLQQHDIAGHQRLRRNLPNRAAAQYRGLCSREALQRCQCLVGAPGLHQPDGGIEQHNDHDHQRVQPIADHAGDQGRCQQHPHHEVIELLQQQDTQAMAADTGQGVGAIVARAVGGLVLVQTQRRVHTVRLDQRGHIAQMPVVR